MKYWTRQESKERFPKPITPLGWSLLHVPLEATLKRMSETFGIKKYANSEMILWENFYVYTRKNFFSDLKNLKLNYLHAFKISCFIGAAFFETLFKSFSEEGPFKGRLTNRIFYKLFGRDVEALIKRWPLQIKHLKDIMGRNYHLSNTTEIDFETFFKVRSQMQEDSKLFFAEDFNVYFLKKLVFGVLKSQLQVAGVSSSKAEEMLASLSNNLQGNFSVVMIEDFNNKNISLEELKKRYGHLTDNWDLYAPTFGEQDFIWANRSFGAGTPLSVKNTVAEDIKVKLGWNKSVSELIEWLQKLVLMDEDLRAYSSLQYPEARVLMNKVEQTAAWRELILPDDSIYFLHLNEIEHGLKKSNFHIYFDLIRQRRAAFMAALKVNPPFELTEVTPGAFKTEKISNENTQVLKGVCVSAGSVNGVVTHINEYADVSKITKNSIIVIESATPVYAPFYALAGGIISEMGGQLSHGAIVAREYGIPMLASIENVCVILREGQNILLDADNGIIKVIN